MKLMCVIIKLADSIILLLGMGGHHQDFDTIELMERTDHWDGSLLGGANEVVMYENVKQGRVGLNIVFEPALRNPKGGGEGGVRI